MAVDTAAIAADVDIAEVFAEAFQVVVVAAAAERLAKRHYHHHCCCWKSALKMGDCR